jgi:hypothetical protein
MITWTCHICKEERPDDKIGVFSTDLSSEYGFPLGTLTQNVRYCVDDPTCTSGAKAKRLVFHAMAKKALTA